MSEARIKIKNLPPAPKPTKGENVTIVNNDDAYWLYRHDKRRPLVDPKKAKPLGDKGGENA